ncbi:hypothetical protein HID58_018318 [Brassica napus]|uniref:Uncharacterized protein n=1 Tax=Brassica napus TaxID=3708 RepID=A0ABQ8DAP2_BRANA|nr:hypothetical protein HID58_018318 [Brassica napus]
MKSFSSTYCIKRRMLSLHRLFYSGHRCGLGSLWAYKFLFANWLSERLRRLGKTSDESIFSLIVECNLQTNKTWKFCFVVVFPWLVRHGDFFLKELRVLWNKKRNLKPPWTWKRLETSCASINLIWMLVTPLLQRDKIQHYLTVRRKVDCLCEGMEWKAMELDDYQCQLEELCMRLQQIMLSPGAGVYGMGSDPNTRSFKTEKKIDKVSESVYPAKELGNIVLLLFYYHVQLKNRRSSPPPLSPPSSSMFVSLSSNPCSCLSISYHCYFFNSQFDETSLGFTEETYGPEATSYLLGRVSTVPLQLAPPDHEHRDKSSRSYLEPRQGREGFSTQVEECGKDSTITLSQSKFHGIRKRHQPSIKTDRPTTSYKAYVSVTNSSMIARKELSIELKSIPETSRGLDWSRSNTCKGGLRCISPYLGSQKRWSVTVELESELESCRRRRRIAGEDMQ